jgi:hypothetical protein
MDLVRRLEVVLPNCSSWLEERSSTISLSLFPVAVCRTRDESGTNYHDASANVKLGHCGSCWTAVKHQMPQRESGIDKSAKRTSFVP